MTAGLSLVVKGTHRQKGVERRILGSEPLMTTEA